MYIVVGLGNPGTKYSKTRHNIGFMVLDILAEKLGIDIKKIKHKAVIGEGTFEGKKVVLAKPQTYMNLSGESLVSMRNWYKAETSNIIVVYDDIDLKTGILRIRPNGSSGTHNGMKSIIHLMGTDEFPRVRLGMGPLPEQWDLKDYVLSSFTPEEIPLVREACQRAVKGIELIISKGVTEAMNECNG